MPTKIFVGNLNEKSASEDLRVLFEKYGEVSECDIIKNFGFVVSHTVPVYYLLQMSKTSGCSLL